MEGCSRKGWMLEADRLLPFWTWQVIEEREKLKSDREARQKKMYYLRTELERLHKQQGIRQSFHSFV